MKIVRSKFESRQYMVRPNFELTHLRDELPGNIKEHAHDFYEVYFMNAGGQSIYWACYLPQYRLILCYLGA